MGHLMMIETLGDFLFVRVRRQSAVGYFVVSSLHPITGQLQVSAGIVVDVV
jgi:hypothetical protein